MRKNWLFILCTIPFFLSAQPEKKLEEVIDFGSNPGNLKMFVHVPIKLNNSPKPLVVVLHGCSQNAHDVAVLSGWNKIADTNDFVVLYPQQKIINNVSDCFNWFRDDDINKNMGESESIYQMIQTTKQQYKIDTTQIFITGLSAGAAMSVVMMATHPEVFNAGAIFAGGAYKIATGPVAAMQIMRGKTNSSSTDLVKSVSEQNPDNRSKYPKMIIYQGTKDPIVNKKNANYLITQWTGINNCDTIADKVENSFSNIPSITRSEYVDRSGKNTVIVYYEVKDLAHQLLVNPGTKANEGGRTGIFGVDRDFHSTYQTALDFGIIKQKK